MSEPGLWAPDDVELARLRSLPYAERDPRTLFLGEPHFERCGPCFELQTGSTEHGLTLANHPCWKLNAQCICGCAEAMA